MVNLVLAELKQKNKFGTEFARANLEVARAKPCCTATGEIVGGLTMPFGKAKTTLGAMGKVRRMVPYGAAYGFGSGESAFADK